MRHAVKLCDVCMKYKPAQQKEPLVPHDAPSLPWFKLRVDIFGHRSHHYLLVADYFSKFPVVKKLTNQTVGHELSLLKTIHCIFRIWGTSNSVHRSGKPVCVPGIQTICLAVQIRSATLWPKVSSVKWFHRGHGQSSKGHNGEGRRFGFLSASCNVDLSCDPNQTRSAQPRRDTFPVEI